ncbi:MAG: hypothetical protein QNK23_06405 [Crocinitomicaceae bacterium]|nr:hypothetical protein [Crocinitomicaceae bacterium]
MKKLTLLIIGTFIMGASLFAQDTRVKMEPEEKAEKMTLKMTERLSLDESTSAQVQTINLDFITDLAAIRSDEALPKEDRKKKIVELKSELKNELKAVLNAEQFAELEAWEAEKKARIEERKALKNATPEERANATTKKLTELLSLTPNQIERVRILNILVEEKIEVIKNDDSMTPEKKKEFIKGNRTDQKAALKSLLTEEQIVILEEAKKNRHDH